ncbi:hypothetical protein DACRYDRAFT_19995 [Dacryopinax primogenitus]|uniref:Elongin-A n=1 Tax=Dacryopinax primogenitus (strain DJM 731) TaxID=1858805 RepID=M5GAY1_DACPD|nr:uncharacterized protein DACRYDRAFT_19995 [Dacryopinax primogenitus]EJU05545.1 hypothetical protein DACRYDRAFT_19995 [Dacryopinax primogenitus]
MDMGAERPEQPRPILPSLKELCIRVVYNNLPSVTSFGQMSYETVKPFLIRMDAQQLHRVEENSPHLIDLDEEIWKALCTSEFIEIRRAVDSGQFDLPGSWREVYDEAESARDAKFALLQEKMKNNYKALAHEKEAKQIKVIEKAPPAKRRAFSCASIVPFLFPSSFSRNPFFSCGGKADSRSFTYAESPACRRGKQPSIRSLGASHVRL